MQTGQRLADLLRVPVKSDARLNEVRRPRVRDDSEFTKMIQSYLSGDIVTGWEPHETVVQRMQDAIGHVTWTSASSGAREFWMAFSTPDGWLVDPPTVRRLVADRSL